MFLAWHRNVARKNTSKSECHAGRSRPVAPRLRRPLVLEVLESRLAPATAFYSMPNTTLVGNGGGGMIANFPVNVSSLTEGLSAANIALSFPTGVFSFPVGSGAAVSDVTVGTVLTGGTTNWTLTANSTADGELNISVAAKPGAGHAINAPPQNFAATLTTGGSLTVGQTYFYTITAVVGTESVPAPAVTVTPTTGKQTASLTWSAVASATSYKIYRSNTSTFTTPSLVKTITGGTTGTTDTGTATTTGAPPAIPSGTVVLVTFPISPEYDGPGGSTPPAPGTVTSQPITINAVNGAFNTQIAGGGSAGAYSLSPAPPYSGTVGVKTVAIAAPTVLTAGTFATGTAAILNGGTDPNGDPVTSVTITNAGSGYTAAPTVSFFSASGSGAAGTAVLGTGAQAGQVVSVTITSPGSGYVSAPLVTFSAPPQTFSTESNTTLNQPKPGLLAGASDPQGTPITVNMINGKAYTVGTAVTLPSGASLTVNQDGSFAYVPAHNFVGPDSFTFAGANFYNAESNTATVNITVTPTLSLVPETMPPTVPPGQTITEQVVMDNPNPAGGVGPVEGFNIALTYDPNQLTTASDGSQTALGSLFPTDWTFTPNVLTSGVVGIGAFGSGSGTDLVSSPAPIVLCTLTFTVVGTTTNATDIDLQAAVTTPAGSPTTGISGTSSQTFFLNPSLPGQVTSVTLTNGGSGYTAAPMVTFSAGGGGSGAVATAVLQHGGTDPTGDPVTAILITRQGDSYTTPPDVIINGGGGSGAAATASVMGPGFIPGVDTQVNPGMAGLIIGPTTLPNGDVGAAYDQTISATGGTTPYTFSKTGTLPSGLTLNSSTGILSGTPTATGTFPFTVTATDATMLTSSQAYTVTINQQLAITTTALPPGRQNVAYSQTIVTTGGTPPVAFSASPSALPAGLTLNPSTGVLSGTPTAGGTYTFTVTATDAVAVSTSRSYTVTITPALAISTSSLPNGDRAVNYTQTIIATGGTTPYTFTSPGTLPAGLTLNSSTGVLSGTPTATGTFAFTITATDATMFTSSQAYTITINPPVVIITTTLPNGDVGASYAQDIGGSGGSGSYTFTVTPGSLPGGLGLSNGGHLSGTPTMSSSFTFTVTASDTLGGSASHNYTILINPPVTITTTTLPNGDVGFLYQQSINASGGAGSLTLTIAKGNLPTGLTLSTSGMVSGTPTNPGSFDFTVTAQDSLGGSASQSYTIPIGKTLTTVSSSAPSSSVDGQFVTFTATVTPADAGTVTPTGTVQFNIGGVSYGSPVNLTGGVATISDPLSAAGSPYSVTATYNGDGKFFSSSGNLAGGQVVQAITSAALDMQLGSQPAGVNIAVTVGQANNVFNAVNGVKNPTNPTTLTVNFGGQTTTATMITAPAHLTLNVLNTVFTASTVVVSPGPINITSSTFISGMQEPALDIMSGAECTLRNDDIVGSATPPAIEVEHGASLNMGTNPTADPGDNTITVPNASGEPVRNDSGNPIPNAGNTFNWMSSQTVNPLPTNLAVTSVSSSIPDPPVYGQSITFTATVRADADAANKSTPTGMVQFLLDGSTYLKPLSGGTASISDSNLPVGTNTVVATYMGDANFNIETGRLLVDQEVAQAFSRTTVSYSANPTPSLTATVGPVGPGAGTPTGTVQFSFDGGSVSGQLTNGTATIAAQSYNPATDTVTASYLGDQNFLTSKGALAPGGLSQFQVTPQGNMVAGTAFLVAVQAVDSAWNPITKYSGPSPVTATLSPSNGTSITVPINGNGLGLFLENVQVAGTYSVLVADSSDTFTGVSPPVTVAPGPAATLVFGSIPTKTPTPTGMPLAPVTVEVQDLYGNVVTSDNTDKVTIAIASGPGTFTAGSTTTATVTGGVATFNNLILAVPGAYTLSAVVSNEYTGPSSASFTVAPLTILPSLTVNGAPVNPSVAPSPSGFSFQFSGPFLVNSTTPVLYGQSAGASGPIPSVTLTQIFDAAGNQVNNPIAGSLVLDTASNIVTFVATDTSLQESNGSPILPAGTYKVVVHSSAATNGFQAINSGGFLDGLGNGTAGSGDYTASFTVTTTAAQADVVWVPATADGPGQALNAPGNNQIGGGYPVYINDNTGLVTSVQLTLNYNAALLTVTGASNNSKLPGSTFVLSPSSTPGHAVLTYSDSGADAANLDGAMIKLGFLTATVPSGSTSNPMPYKAKDLLIVSGVSINNGTIQPVGSEAVHLVAYVGDADGNGMYSSNDALLITRAQLNTDTGFTAYPLVDPVIVSDTDGSSFIPADAPLQVSEAGVGFATANLAIPPIPAGVVSQPVANNVDPTVSIPRDLFVGPDGTITVPVNIDDARPAGSTGLIEGHLALTYDPHEFTVSAADVHAGSVLAGGGWSIVPTIDPASGQIAIALSGVTPISNTIGGSLVTIDFHLVGRISNLSSIALVASATPNGQFVRTELEDAQGTFTLSSPPSGGSVGTVTLTAPARTIITTTDYTDSTDRAATGLLEESASRPSELVVQGRGASADATEVNAAESHGTIGAVAGNALAATQGAVPSGAFMVLMGNLQLVNVFAWQHIVDPYISSFPHGASGIFETLPANLVKAIDRTLAGAWLPMFSGEDLELLNWDGVGSDAAEREAWRGGRGANAVAGDGTGASPDAQVHAATDRNAIDSYFSQWSDDSDEVPDDE